MLLVIIQGLCQIPEILCVFLHVLFFVKSGPCLVVEDGVLWRRKLLKSFSGFCKLVMEAL